MADPIYRQLIADRIYYLRTEIFKLTQEKLARRLGMNQMQTISKYEAGKLRPSMRRCNQLIQIAAEVGLTIDYKWLRPDAFS